MKLITSAALAVAALFAIMWLGWQEYPWLTFGEAGRLVVHEWRGVILGAGGIAIPAIVYVWVLKGRAR